MPFQLSPSRILLYSFNMNPDLAPVLGKHHRCPHSGLFITTKPAWQNIRTGDDYTMSYGIIGENTLFTSPCGNIRTVQMELTVKARDRVISEHFGHKDPVITEIRDFSNVHGIPSHQTRSLFRQSFTNQINQKGLFVINTSWIVKAVFLAGLRLQKMPFPLTLSSSYAAAISGALDLLNNKTQTSKTEWRTKTDTIEVVHKIINNSIIFTQAKGQLVQKDIAQLLKTYETLLRSGELAPGPIFRIADYTNITQSDWKSRFLLVKGLNKLHDTLNLPPSAMAVYGLTTPLGNAMRLASRIIKYPIFLANNEKQAFSYIYKRRQGLDIDTAEAEKHPQEVEDILRFISTIIWDDSDEMIQTDFDNQTLTPISEALLVVKQDVSDLLHEARAQTAEIAKKNRQLEAEIRNRKKIEQRLTAAIEQAEAATRAKGDFLATMSHEIRTPMNGILGMIHLLENTELTAKQRSYLNISNNSATSLLKLINDILDFSKVDQGQLQMEVIPFDLAELCTTCCNLLKKNIQTQPLELNCTLDPGLKNYTIGDPGKLRQVLMNLLNNAIKFTPSGSITLRTEVHNQTPQLAAITFSVQDTGIGIAPDKTNAIFDIFSQADSSTTRQYGGTGLGLSISRKICEFMEGELEVQSVVGEGTTFSFTLPFGLGHRLPKRVSTKPKLAPPQPLQHNIRILVVEDEPVNQLFVETLLDQFGYQHTHAKNGSHALEILKDKSFHIILMDCQMPIMDGYETTAKIRSMPLQDITPIIIALTAHAMDGDRERCIECGMDDYLAKPIIPSLLFETIEKHLPETT